MADGLDLGAQIAGAIKGLRRQMADIGGATSPEMKKAATVLRLSIKDQLARRGARGHPSAPGEPPFRQRLLRHGKAFDSSLWKSIGFEVVGGVMRVGSSDFVARLMQEGVDATAATTAQRIAGYRASAFAAKRRKRKSGLATRRIHFAARPFMQRAADQALPKMEGDFVLTIQKRIEGGTGPLSTATPSTTPSAAGATDGGSDG